MDYGVYSLSVSFSTALMVLFVFINYPYYKLSHGDKAQQIVIRTILLNSLAILIGWGPAVYFWPNASQKFLLPAAAILGALGCVGSRFIYPEIVPRELAKAMIELMERKIQERENET